MRLENLYPNFAKSPPAVQLQLLAEYRLKRAEDMAKPNTFRVKKASATALTEEEKVVMKILKLKKKDILAMREM